MIKNSKKIKYDPNTIFKNKKISYFVKFEDLKDQYSDFTNANGMKEWINSIVVISFFLAVEAIIIANYPPFKNFISSFFSLNR